MSHKRFRLGFPGFLILLLVMGSLSVLQISSAATSLDPSAAPSSISGQWYKGDLHKHTWLFGGKRDLGDIVYNYKKLGYNFLFQGDHDYGKLNGYNFTESLDVTTGGLIKMVGDEWDRSPEEVPTSPCSSSAGVAEITSTRARTGTNSMHLSLSTSSLSCNGFWWDTNYHDETVSFARGTVLLNFSVYPTQLTQDKSGLAVHMYINVRSRPYDITLSNNTTVPTKIGGGDDGKVEFSVFYGIVPFANTTFKKAIRISTPTLNTWNTYSLNLSEMIPRAFGFGFHPSAGPYSISIRAYSSGSFRSEFFIDDFYLYNHNALSFKELQAWKNSIIHTWDTATFKTYGSIEFSYLHHLNYHYFNYLDPSQMRFSNELVPAGSKNPAYTQLIVDWIHAQGVPAELNHPLTGSDPTLYLGWGTDFMDIMSSTSEVGGLSVGEQNQVLAMWDHFLSRGAWVLGVAVSDSGTVGTSSFATRAPAVYVFAESLDQLSLLKSMYEGRAYFGRQTYNGRLTFNIAPSNEPYPSRYTRFIPDEGSSTSASLYLKATGLTSGWIVRWIRNGTIVASDTITGNTYEAERIFQVPDQANYFRVEIRDPSTSGCGSGNPGFSSSNPCLVAGTNPILFEKVQNLPSRTELNLSNVVTANGLNYTRPALEGIGSVAFGGSTLSFEIRVPQGALSTTYVHTSLDPVAVTGAESWTYDTILDLLTIVTLGSTNVSVELSSASPPPIVSITVTPDPGSTSLGGTIQFEALAYDSNGDPVYGIPFQWSTTVPEATINTVGVFSAGNTSGQFVDAVSATADGVVGYADVHVIESQPASLILQPIGPGSRTQWLRTSTCSANWICVSENYLSHDGDGTYVRSSTIGTADLYDFTTVSSLIPAGSTIEWVKVTLIARKSGTAESTIAVYLRAPTNTVNGDPLSLTTTYALYEQTWLVSPLSGVTWTLSELDVLEVGEIYLSGSVSARVTSVSVEVRYLPP